jgi:hypothetical protein
VSALTNLDAGGNWPTPASAGATKKRIHVVSGGEVGMIRRLLWIGAGLLILALALMATGCSGGNDSLTQMRVLQGSPDEGPIDVLIDGGVFARNVAYARPTNYTLLDPGSRHLQVRPAGSIIVIDETVTLSSGTNYTLIANNYASVITPVLLRDDKTPPGSGNIKLRFVNAGAGAGAVDVYVLAPGTTPPGNSPTVSNLNLGAASTYLSMAAGTYEIFVTITGTTFVYFDSGPLTFSAGQNRSMVVMSDLAGGYTTLTLRDRN